MKRRRILFAIVDANESTINVKWQDISFNADQLSGFQQSLIQQSPALDLVKATTIILRNQCDLHDEEDLIIFLEGTHVFATDLGRVHAGKPLNSHIKEIEEVIEQCNKIGAMVNWDYEGLRSKILGKNG